MSLRFAFVGFRHDHIRNLYDLVKTTDGLELVAACEEHGATRARLKAEGAVEITHADYEAMLADVPCDVVATGDYFTLRGSREVQALAAGKPQGPPVHRRPRQPPAEGPEIH